MRDQATAPRCLRCASVALRILPESSPEQAFFECPSCGRQYGRNAPRQALTYRWPHPLGIALYGVMFEREPAAHAQRIAQMVLAQESPELLAAMVREIDIELAHPTQQVRYMLGCVATEEGCRKFLAAVSAELSAALAKR